MVNAKMTNRKNNELRRLIKNNRFLRDLRNAEIAAALEMSLPCFYKKQQNPEKFTLKELRALFDKLDISFDEWKDCI